MSERKIDFFGTYLSTLAERGQKPTAGELDSARAWADVGNSLYDAMLYKAEEIGGEAFRDEIADLAQTDSWLIPNAQALIVIEERQPGSAMETVSRAEQTLLGKLATQNSPSSP